MRYGTGVIASSASMYDSGVGGLRVRKRGERTVYGGCMDVCMYDVYGRCMLRGFIECS